MLVSRYQTFAGRALAAEGEAEIEIFLGQTTEVQRGRTARRHDQARAKATAGDSLHWTSALVRADAADARRGGSAEFVTYVQNLHKKSCPLPLRLGQLRKPCSRSWRAWAAAPRRRVITVVSESCPKRASASSRRRDVNPACARLFGRGKLKFLADLGLNAPIVRRVGFDTSAGPERRAAGQALCHHAGMDSLPA